MNEEELSETERAFVDIYLTNGRKAGAAYQAVKDNVSKLSADTLGSRMFRKVRNSSYFVQDLYPIGKLPESWFDENVKSCHSRDDFNAQKPCYNHEKERCY